VEELDAHKPWRKLKCATAVGVRRGDHTQNLSCAQSSLPILIRRAICVGALDTRLLSSNFELLCALTERSKKAAYFNGFNGSEPRSRSADNV
jgi:hypothetical protein